MKLVHFLITFATILLQISLVSGFPNGPPLNVEVCINLRPAGHEFPLRLQELNYVITTAKDWFTPGEILQINVSSAIPENDFKGLIMQVRNEDDEVSGSFLEPEVGTGFKLLPCETARGTTHHPVNGSVSHSNSEFKAVGSFRWIAPECSNGSQFIVRATVVRIEKEYQMGMVKTLRCVVNVTEEQLVTRCRNAHVTSLPPNNKYNTSFDTRGSTNGWINRGWTRHRGGTLSSRTGPDSAAHGSYYMYFETSFPAREGDSATLETSADLRGCFCLVLRHSHNVAAGLEHRLTIFAGNEQIYNREGKRSSWRQLRLQIDTPNFIRIRIVGTRGLDYQGDMAIDDIRLEEGWCHENDE